MTKVIHVLSSLNLGGAERFVIDLARLQREHGMDATVLSLGSPDDPLVEEVRAQKIPLSIADKIGNRFQRYNYVFQLFRKSDVIQIHSPHALRFLAPLLVLLSGKKIIYTRHGLDPLSNAKWLTLHRLMRIFLHRVSFVTDSGLDSFKKTYNWDPEKLCIIENGVYIPEDNTPSVALPVRLGSVGRLVPLKGQHFLLDSIRLLEATPEIQAIAEPYRLNFYGTGPSEVDLQAQTAALSHPDRVTFHGLVIDREQIYQNINVLVVSSETEGLSLAIMEAMARGICVVATEVGGNSRLVHPGKTGILIPYGNAQALADALLSLILKPELIAEYGYNASQFIKQHYSLEVTHEAYLSCYSS